MASTEATGYRIDFEPLGRHGDGRPDRSLLEAARELGVDLNSVCGGHGHCGQCQVRVVTGEASAVTGAERGLLSAAELAGGMRLACQAYPRGACVVDVPADSLGAAMRSQVEGREAAGSIDPIVRASQVELEPPALGRAAADADALLAALPGVDTIDVGVLRGLSPALRRHGWRCTAHVRGREVVAVNAPATRAVGLAVDLGTTGVAGYLLDLEQGQVLAARGTMNPQIAFGEDVISRIVHARQSAAAREQLRQQAADCLDQLAGELCAEVGLEPTDVVEAVVVGNTAMHHLLLGLPTEQLALSPFVPAVAEAVTVKARDANLGLAPGAYLHLLPNIASFVGADHVAVLLATEADWRGRNALVLDIGTNTEVSLIARDGTIRSLSAPSGPAFEGYHIVAGMRATAGAIERIFVSPEEVEVQTIGGGAPVGICGSGIVDALAQLHLCGVLSTNGRIQLGSHANVRERDEHRSFLLVDADDSATGRPIEVTQEDVREILLAKAAIQSGIAVLLSESELEADDLDVVVIAGAFGSYLSVENAAAVGMLPALPVERLHQVGNAAGAGAKLALVSRSARAHARELRERVRYIELASHPQFVRRYAESCRL
jgi:uncharacterized 2Fe-2S/4Fe-4S cluster protein (DUF4445 family)